MIRTAPVFESTLQLQPFDPTRSAFISQLEGAEPTVDQHPKQHRFKNRLQKIIRIPPSVAQTHTRMTTIRLGISRVEKKNLTSAVTANSNIAPTTTEKLASVNSTLYATATAQDGEEASAPATPIPSPNAQGSTERSSHFRKSDSSGSNLEYGEESYPMAPRDGFTVSHSLFAKVRARVLHSQRPQQRQQQQQQQQQRPALIKNRSADSGSSQLDEEVEDGEDFSKRPNDGMIEVEVESNSSNSNTNTLSAGTSGNLNKGHHTIELHINNSLRRQHDVDNSNDPSNDSDSTVTEIEESAARLRQRKYSFESRRSSSIENGMTDLAVVPAPTPVPAPGVGVASGGVDTIAAHAEVITEEQTEGLVVAIDTIAATEDNNSKGEDTVKLFEEVLHRQHLTEEAIAASLHELRQLILAYGIPEEPTPSDPKTQAPSIRSRCWKLLLEVHHVSAQEYVSLVKQGRPEEYGKIRNDTFRTLATDRKFRDAVVEESLIRVLCAFAWSTQATSLQETGVSFTYVQGMNVLAAPFLYAMSEMEAFYSYSNFLKYCCPLYVQPTLQGVHCGIKLLERCLCEIDVELYNYLQSKKLSAELYAFPSVLTICACTPPLDQAMQLWDFLLAWGVHLNIICIIAQLHLIRDSLMSHSSPMKLLRILPDLDAELIIRETVRMVKLLPDELYDLLVRHPYDPTVADQIS
ncbi:hypothetical protein BGX28_008038 [Mortierella sp. GBA30]|nr:hypothetical protein BGX28_008038 [Mortierella sp. GBA30]